MCARSGGARTPIVTPVHTALSQVTLFVFSQSPSASDSPSTPISLSQNYPNPFNPKTVIGSQLPAAGHVKLAVYDLLGREVAVLVNGWRAAGSYQDAFDGSGLASGVYFYRLQVRPLGSTIGPASKSGAGSFVDTKKLLLVK